MSFRSASLEIRNGIVWVSIASALGQFANILSAILVANVVGPRNFGEFAFLQGTLTNWSQAAALSSGLLATRYLAAYAQSNRDLAGRVIGYCTVITTVAGGIAGLILLAGKSYLTSGANDTLGLGVVFIAITIPFMSLTLFQTGALVGMERYRLQAGLGAVQFTVFVAMPFVGAKLAGAIGAVAGLAAAVFTRFLLQRIALIRAGRSIGVYVTYNGLGSMGRLFMRFALPASLAGLSAGVALWISSLLLVKQVGGQREMGLFSAAQYFRLIVLFLPIQLSTIGVPMLTRHLAGGAQGKYAALLRTGIILTSVIALSLGGILAIAAPTMLRLFGIGFLDAVSVTRLMLLGAVIEAIAGSIYQILPSREQMWRSFFLVALPRDLLFLLASTVLIPRHLSMGFGASLLLSQCVGLVGVLVARHFSERDHTPKVKPGIEGA